MGDIPIPQENTEKQKEQSEKVKKEVNDAHTEQDLEKKLEARKAQKEQKSAGGNSNENNTHRSDSTKPNDGTGDKRKTSDPDVTSPDTQEKVKKTTDKIDIPKLKDKVGDWKKADGTKGIFEGKKPDNPKDNGNEAPSKDKKENTDILIRKIEKTCDSLARKKELLVKMKDSYKLMIGEMIEKENLRYEDIKGTSENFDRAADVATTLVDITGFMENAATNGAKALEKGGETLSDLNHELTVHAVDIAKEPIRDAAIKGIFDHSEDNSLKKVLHFALIDIKSPSYWAQLVTGSIDQTHTDLIEHLNRDRNETSDKFDKAIWDVDQQISHLNAQRDTIISSQ